MSINNMINSATNSSGWTSFTTNITAIGTNPNPGGQNRRSYYLQIGYLLNIRYNFTCNSSGSGGSGAYIFNIPSGFTIDTSVVPTFASTARAALGCGFVINYSSSIAGFAVPYVYDSTNYLIAANATGSTSLASIGSTWYSLTDSIGIFVSLEVPIIY